MFKFLFLLAALIFVAMADNMMDPMGVTPVGDKEKVLGEFHFVFFIFLHLVVISKMYLESVNQ